MKLTSLISIAEYQNSIFEKLVSMVTHFWLNYHRIKTFQRKNFKEVNIACSLMKIQCISSYVYPEGNYIILYKEYTYIVKDIA